MPFDVGSFLRQSAGATRAYRLSDRQDPSDGMAAADIMGTVSFVRTREGILVSACLVVVSNEVCSRCLEPLQSVCDIDFKEEFAPTIDIDTGARLSPPDDVFTIDEHQLLDLNEAIRQYRAASRAMQPLCRPDCRGLCPDCGANLNLGPCACPIKSADPRWDALTELRRVRARISDEERGS
jgi:DUF177 domain-containing protein